MFDRTSDGSSLKWVTIEDEFMRESVALIVDRGIRSEDVIDTLAELFAMWGVTEHIRGRNGAEFTARASGRWLPQHSGITQSVLSYAVVQVLGQAIDTVPNRCDYDDVTSVRRVDNDFGIIGCS